MGRFRLVLPSSALAMAVFVISTACGKERPVEAPFVDVAIGALDASARPVEPGPLTPEKSASPMAGRWEGIGRQDDGQTWEMIVDLSSTAQGVCATAEYPTIPCRAEWICIGEEMGELQAHERLLDDSARRCIDNGTMRMHLRPDGMLEWRWSGQGQSAAARLRRAR